MEIWNTYYLHWAKETQQLQKQVFVKKCVRRTTESILNNLGFGDLEELQAMIHRYPRPDQKMEMLKLVADVLFPLETPRETDYLILDFDLLRVVDDRLERGRFTPGFVLNPTEFRFWKNMGDTAEEAMYHDEVLDSKQAHRLDAILALR